MGFFSGLSSLVSSAVGYVGKVVENVISNPFSLITKVVDWIRGTKELKEAPPYKGETATMDETFKVSELLEKQRSNFSSSVKDLEKLFISLSSEILKDISLGAKKINETFDCNINSSFIDKSYTEFLNEQKGKLAEEINRKVQISDSECSEILRLSGEEREKEIDIYIKRIVRKGMDKFVSNLTKKTEGILEISEHSINVKMTEKQRDLEKLLEDLEEAQYTTNIQEKDQKNLELTKKKEDFSQFLKLINA